MSNYNNYFISHADFNRLKDHISAIQADIKSEYNVSNNVANKIVNKVCIKIIQNKKFISTKDIEEIKYNVRKSAQITIKKLAHKRKFYIEKHDLLNTFVERLHKQNIKLEDPAQVEKMWEDYYQITAGVMSYINWKKGDVIPGPHPSLPNYKVQKRIKNKEGLQVVMLIPENQGKIAMSPILCCRGLSNLANFADSGRTVIGQTGFETSKNEILQNLKEASELYGPVVVTGHSLGGCTGQLITAEFCDYAHNEAMPTPLIKSLYHYGAPGVGKKVTSDYSKKLVKLPQSHKPKVVSYRHAEDGIFFIGGSHLQTIKKNRRIIGHFRFSFFMHLLSRGSQAHSWTKLISESDSTRFQKKYYHSYQIILRRITERVRRLAGFFLTSHIHQKVELEKKRKEITENFKKYITNNN